MLLCPFCSQNVITSSTPEAHLIVTVALEPTSSSRTYRHGEGAQCGLET